MATEIRMPQFGVSMETGTVAQWLKAEGDTVKVGDVLASIETEKLTNDVVSEVDGVLLKIVAQEGEDVPVQGLMAYVGQPGEALPDAGGTAAPAAAESAPVTVESVPAAGQVSGGRVKASPLARKIAAKLGVDLSQVIPGGTSGRIRADDDSARRPRSRPRRCRCCTGSYRCCGGADGRRHSGEALRYAEGRGPAYAAVPHGDPARNAGHQGGRDGADAVPQRTAGKDGKEVLCQ